MKHRVYEWRSAAADILTCGIHERNSTCADRTAKPYGTRPAATTEPLPLKPSRSHYDRAAPIRLQPASHGAVAVGVAPNVRRSQHVDARRRSKRGPALKQNEGQPKRKTGLKTRRGQTHRPFRRKASASSTNRSRPRRETCALDRLRKACVRVHACVRACTSSALSAEGAATD